MRLIFSELNKTAIGLLSIAALLCVSLFTPLEASAQKVLKGGVQEEYLRINPSGLRGGTAQQDNSGAPTRIHRGRAADSGALLDAGQFASLDPRADRGGPMKGIVDDNAFAQPPKAFDIGTEAGSREMTLAWERWHKQLSEAIYRRWQALAQDPGKATVKVTVTRDRTIRAQVIDGSGNPYFDNTVVDAIMSLNGNQGLTFPSASKRQHVSFEADYIAASNVRPGYSWVKNDYEKIRQDY